MRNVLTRICLIVSACLVACAVAAGQSREVRTRTVDATQADAESPLTNTSVIKLARAKFSDKMIVAVIRTRPAKFDLSPDRLIELKKNGVSERVILAMLARGDANQLATAQLENDPDDDAFFNGLNGSRQKSNAGGQGTQSSPNETDIFGSSGSASGQTRTNGMGSGVSGDTQTTGSATVHIIRPQEQNGAPKLERTPTLTNQSIIDLVEAGFSEGTIIRRIENSPAEFDLSSAKLAELRKRRVTESVINAMRSAMSDDAPAPTTPARPNNQLKNL
ncbi:MAG: hypothetical protein QOF61_2983 [Acidobacteriota bacterium]|nr:hypothetical protein [Acidobacteriota bacterium]